MPDNLKPIFRTFKLIFSLNQNSRSQTLFQIAILLATEFCLTACGSEKSEPHGAVVRDSLGIEIVENFEPLWPEDHIWYLSEEPLLDLSAISVEAEYQFFRITGALKLKDERIAVANAGSYELRLFDSTGQFLKSVGGQGGGPGEFSRLASLHRFGQDSIMTFDSSNRRISIFDLEGNFGRDLTLEKAGLFPLSDAIPLSDASFFVTPAWSSGIDREEMRTGLKRHLSPYLHYSHYGKVLDTLAVLPGLELFRFVNGDRRTLTVPPFGHITAYAVFRNRVYIGIGKYFEIKAYSPEQGLFKLSRLANVDLSLTMEENRESKINRIAQSSDKKATTKLLEAIPDSEKRPAYRRFVVDSDGNLWVSRYRSLIEEAEIWWLFNIDLRFLGTVKIPRLRVFDIGPDYLVGRSQDKNEIESIQVFELIKP